MEKKLIEEWLKIEYGSEYDNGSDYYRDGYGDGFGCGSGCGSGDGSSYGDGYGDGFGCGSGYSSGDGDGYGDGDGISKYNEHYVFQIDGINTIITKIKGNIAKGFILNRDLTLENTFVVKGNNMFAHGSSIREAFKSLQEKIFENMNIEEKLEEFKKKFNRIDKYKGTEFFEWHHHLTGSCLQGRQSFVANKVLNVEEFYTVKEFLKIVKGSFGWENLKVLEEYYV